MTPITMIRSLALAGLVTCFASPQPATAVGDLLSPAEAESLGLAEVWHRQVGSIGGGRAIVDLRLWVNKSVQLEYIEVFQKDAEKSAGVLQRIPTHQKDLQGKPLGKAEAERLAKLSVIKLKRRGIEADIRSVMVDQVRLHVLTADGLVATYDAETGEQLWSMRIGKPRLVYGLMGINDRFVTVLNGTTVYRVTAMESEVVDPAGFTVTLPAGRPLPPIRPDGLAIHGVVNSGFHAIIPTSQGGIESHLLEGITIEPGYERFNGRPLAQPVTFPNSNTVMWSTDRGFVYAIESGETPIGRFRLPIDGNAEGGLTAASDDRFFFGSTGGRVYAVKASESGEVLWNRSVGEPFYQAPYVSDERVMISSAYGHLFCLDAESGEAVWRQPTPDVDQVFAHVGPHLIGRDREHHLMVVDAETGEVRRRMRRLFVENVIVNMDTDRAYLVGNGGMVQCLRPFDTELPRFRREIEPLPEVPDDEEQVEQADAAPAAPRGQPDPFGGDADADPAVDPFGN